MKNRQVVVIALVVGIIGIVYVQYRKSQTPRAKAIQVARLLNQAIETDNANSMLKLVNFPPAYAGRTDAEKCEFLTKTLRNEISEEGLRRLMRSGEFGTLLDIFPATGNEWASKAGVSAEKCVAFRLEENGTVAELVLYTAEFPNKIIRINNVN